MILEENLNITWKNTRNLLELFKRNFIGKVFEENCGRIERNCDIWKYRKYLFEEKFNEFRNRDETERIFKENFKKILGQIKRRRHIREKVYTQTYI